MSTELGYNFVRTPPKLCTDNGIMVAWNGVEKWVTNTGVIRNQDKIEKVYTQSKALLGEDWIWKVENENLKCRWIKINKCF